MNTIDPLGLMGERLSGRDCSVPGDGPCNWWGRTPRSTWGDWMNTRIYRPDGRPTTGELFNWEPRHTEALCKVQIEAGVSAEAAMIFGVSSAVNVSFRPATGSGSIGFEQGVLVGFGAALVGELGGGETGGRRGGRSPEFSRTPSAGVGPADTGGFQRFTGGENTTVSGGAGKVGVQRTQRVLGDNAGSTTLSGARVGPQLSFAAGASVEFEANWKETWGKENYDDAR